MTHGWPLFFNSNKKEHFKEWILFTFYKINLDSLYQVHTSSVLPLEFTWKYWISHVLPYKWGYSDIDFECWFLIPVPRSKKRWYRESTHLYIVEFKFLLDNKNQSKQASIIHINCPQGKIYFYYLQKNKYFIYLVHEF